jgi:tetratricopeptide (TPR) repeat protein
MRAFLLVILAALAAVPSRAAGEVKAWQGTLPLPTYQEGPPDPNPPFDQFASTRFNYPYTLRESITDRRVETAWRALFLENEYLKCSVLPDIGGHLYTCIDKVNGQSMFYANPSIKKAQIGYRGAWAAFGIEFNFPVSHNWVSMSPTDFSYRTNADGSASIFVGNIDRPYGMQWTVELRLAPRSAVLEQRVTLYNRSDVRHRFYWWSNAGVRIWDDSKIWYPMRWSASHGFADVDTWPVDSSGVDRSVLRNQKGGTVSRFVHGSREPFMGVYHPHTDAGLVHYSDYAELPAKKIWSWGVDADGLDWRKALSDDNSGYVEVQGGLMRNQETYAFLEPRQTIRFTEYWMPARAIGGIARASLSGVLNVRRDGGKAVFGLNANRPEQGRIRILDGARVVREEQVALDPARTWSAEIAAAPPKLTFELTTSGGAVLMRHTEGEYDWSKESEIKVGPQQKPDSKDALETGTDQELNGNLLAAYETYTKALEKTPDDFALRVAAGRLAASLLRYADAARWLEPAQARATHDPEIAYYLGIACQGLGRLRDARLQFETASRMPRFRAAGLVKLAELLAREGDLPRATAYLEDAVAAEPQDQRAREALLLLRGDRPDVNTGSDPERVLRIAADRMRLGLWKPALELLSREYPAVPPEQAEPGAPLPQQHPIVHYYRAFCLRQSGQSYDEAYATASRLPADYVFPHGPATLEVIEAALGDRPRDAQARFFLGSLRMASGRADDAIAEWREAARIDPSIRVLHANLGRTLLLLKRDAKGAAEAFQSGLKPDPRNAALYAGLGQALSILARPAADCSAALERYPDPPEMPAPLVYNQALSYAESGRFDQARALFRGRFFPRQEGGANVRQVWIRVLALQAQSEAEAGRCDAALKIVDGIGQPVDGLVFTRDGLDRFIEAAPNQAALGIAEARCGRKDRAAARLKEFRGFDAAVFGYELAKLLPGTQSPAPVVRGRARSGGSGRGGSWALAVAGLAELQAGRTQEGRQRLEDALLLPDSNLAHHFARVGLRKAGR